MHIKSINIPKFIWISGLVLATLFLAIVIVPPMINLNSLKDKIETTISKETGIKPEIRGNVNFSLLGHATIIAHNVSIPNGVISSIEFNVPLFSIFDLERAEINNKIKINGASLVASKIIPFDINTDIIVNDSKVKFLNKEYNIISAKMSKQNIDAIVKTDQHKYQIKSVNNKFDIKNKNNELSISGTLYPNGTANAHITINAQDINRWFEFEKPKITKRFPITAHVIWNGEYGFDFSNISANGATGNIILHQDGYKIIKLENKNADYDMSFILKDTDILKNASFDLDFYGKIKFLDKQFKHLYINTIGSNDEIKVNKIIADDLEIQGGTIDASGAHDLFITLPENGIKTTCVFNGTPNKWSCREFSYDDKIFGTIFVDRENFNISISGNTKIIDMQKIINSAKRFGNHGTIKFNFSDTAGVIKIDGKDISIKYDFATNKNLNWAGTDLPFLPEFMTNENGNIVWKDNTMYFIPDSKTWNLSTNKDYFYISGNDFKKWFPNVNLDFLRNYSYIISGNYKHGNISDLTIEVANHKFIGSVSDKTITLKTDALNLDSFMSAEFFDNFEELSFFVNAPIVIPFELDTNVSISAKSLVYHGQKYNNFVYSLKKANQTFSITDSDRGNLLANLKKNNTKYDINIKLNKFVWDEKLLPQTMPLNISDSTITAEIKLKTSGKIAHDIFANIKGNFDATFDGGVIYGLGTESFYASAQNITLLNAEYAMARALESGTSPIKKMHIIGEYNMGDIKTIEPLTLSLRHTDIIGTFQIEDKKMFAKLKITLRGTSPTPKPIDVIVYDNGYREYSLSEIMMNFDSEYMHSFIKSHEKF